MTYTHFSVRYAITANTNSYNVVLMVDQMEKHFITIPHYGMGEFISKAARNFPLFIVEEVPRILGPDVDFIPRRDVLTDMVIEQCKDLKANLYIAPYQKIPKHFRDNYKARGIAENYHKPLWLCTFNVSFENLANKYDNE